MITSEKLLFCITAHSEGVLLHRAIDSVQRFLNALPQEVEGSMILLADSVDSATELEISRIRIPVRRLEFKDVARVRNFALDTYGTEYSYLAFIDGDDWIEILDALRLKQNLSLSAGPKIIAPEVRYIHARFPFDMISIPFHQPSMTKPNSLKSLLLGCSNLWASCIVVVQPSDVQIRYPVTSEKYLFEDWWYMIYASDAGIPIQASGYSLHVHARLEGSRRRLQRTLKRSAGGFRTPTSELKCMKILRLIASGLIFATSLFFGIVLALKRVLGSLGGNPK
jgi:hypothetical protein